MAAESAVYLVLLKAEGDGPPAAVRLRHWLKRALRGCGLRAVRVEEVPPARDAGPSGAPKGGRRRRSA